MPAPSDPLQKLLLKFGNSRDFTISFVIHLILVMVLGTTVIVRTVTEPDDLEGSVFPPSDSATLPPPDPNVTLPPPASPDVAALTPPGSVVPANLIQAITSSAPNARDFVLPNVPPAPSPVLPANPGEVARALPPSVGEGIPREMLGRVKDFAVWNTKPGAGGVREQEFQFTAYLGQYSGGDWNSTVRVSGGQIETGSLPNLLYLMSHWSKDRIKTNYKNVKAIKLDSDEIFAIKPPFIFLTGTRDFVLTDKEIENLNKYVRSGGCIWGDSSVPGKNSRFDIAFKREMKRVLPDVDKDFEALPANHPIFGRDAYFPEIKTAPPGINFYSDAVQALRVYGEIAVLYTSNDYGDMWQVGLDPKGQVDLRKNDRNQFVAISGNIWENRGDYIRNISPESLEATYKFGTNVVCHLLTRWESKVRNAPSL